MTLLGCKSNTSIDSKCIFESALKKDTLSDYFPSTLNDTLIIENGKYKNLEQRWLSSILYSFNEPILYTKTDMNINFRLLILSSYNIPVCFHIKEYKGNYYIKAKYLKTYRVSTTLNSKSEINENDTNSSKVKFSRVIYDTVKIITNSEWNIIEQYITKINFWESNSLETNNGNQSTDGTTWILEGRKNGKYHFIIRHQKIDDIKKFGKELNKIISLSMNDNFHEE